MSHFKTKIRYASSLFILIFYTNQSFGNDLEIQKFVDEYDKTIFVEEALFRLVEIYYRIGLIEEAKAAASLLGYNYNSSEWFEQSYKILNKDNKIKKSPKKNIENDKTFLKKIIEMIR